MHELKMARGLFKKLEEEAQKKSLPRVSKVVLSVGAASGIDPHFLEHSLRDHIFPSTIFQGATLEIKVTEPSLVCRNCSGRIDASSLSASSMLIAACPLCGSPDIEIASGNDVEIIEVA